MGDRGEYLIGMSLSLCIRDILESKVMFGDIKCIISGTKIKNNTDFAHVRDRYCKVYWKKNPIRATNIFRGLYDSGKLIQPRLLGLKSFNISDGYWYERIIS